MPEQALDEALDAVHRALRADARSWAAQVRATARLVEAARAAGGVDRAFVELEVAGSWSVGQATATRSTVEAEHLTTCLPATSALLEHGALLVHQARVLLHVTRSCTPAVDGHRPRSTPVPSARPCPTTRRADAAARAGVARSGRGATARCSATTRPAPGVCARPGRGQR